MAIKNLVIFFSMLLSLQSIYGAESDERLTCESYASKFANGETIPDYGYDGIGLSGPSIMGRSAGLAFVFCNDNPSDCGAHMCPGDVYSIDIEKKKYQKLFEVWGGGFTDAKLAPGGRYLAFSAGYRRGGIIGGRYPEVWNLKTKEQLSTRSFYEEGDKSWYSLVSMEWIGPAQLNVELEELRMPKEDEGFYGVVVNTKTEVFDFSKKVNGAK